MWTGRNIYILHDLHDLHLFPLDSFINNKRSRLDHFKFSSFLSYNAPFLRVPDWELTAFLTTVVLQSKYFYKTFIKILQNCINIFWWWQNIFLFSGCGQWGSVHWHCIVQHALHHFYHYHRTGQLENPAFLIVPSCFVTFLFSNYPTIKTNWALLVCIKC